MVEVLHGKGAQEEEEEEEGEGLTLLAPTQRKTVNGGGGGGGGKQEARLTTAEIDICLDHGPSIISSVQFPLCMQEEQK